MDEARDSGTQLRRNQEFLGRDAQRSGFKNRGQNKLTLFCFDNPPGKKASAVFAVAF
jgi:hypothetical protein